MSAAASSPSPGGPTQRGPSRRGPSRRRGRVPPLLGPWLALVSVFALAGWLEAALRPSMTAAPIAAWGGALCIGIAIAALVVRGPRLWSAVAVGVMAGQALLHRYTLAGPPEPLMVPGDLIIAAGAALQATAAAAFLHRRFGVPLRLRSARALALAVVGAGPLAGLVAPAAIVLSASIQQVVLSPVVGGQALAAWVVGSVATTLMVPLSLLNPRARPGVVMWQARALPRLGLRPFLYLLVSLTASLSLWLVAETVVLRGARVQFKVLTDDSLRAITHRLDTTNFALDAGAALFAASDRVTTTDWRRFAEGLDIARQLPGISGLGYVQPVSRAGLARYLAELRAEGAPAPRVASAGEGAGDQLFITRFIEPEAGNRAAIGIDIAADATRRAAAIASRDSGRTVLAWPAAPAQEAAAEQGAGTQGAGKQGGGAGPGFLLLRPIYRPGAPAATVAERRAAFRGWVCASFAGRRLLADLTPSQGRSLLVTVREGRAEAPGTTLFASPTTDGNGFLPAFRRVETLSVFGRDLTVIWTGTAEFERGLHRQGPALLLVCGLLFTLLLAVFLLSTTRREDLIRQTVARKTREIAAQEAETRSILDTAVVMIALLDGDGVILTANDAIARLFGYRRDELEGMVFSALLSGETADYFARSSDPRDTTGFRGIVQTMSHQGAALALDTQIRAWLTEDGLRRHTVVMRNVADRLRIEAQLRHTQYRLDVALKGANIGVFDVDLVTGESIVSETWKELMGFPPGAEIDSQAEWSARIHPDDVAAVEKADSDCIAGLTERSISEYRIRAVDDGWRWMRSDGLVAERDASGRALRLIGVQMDITEQKRASQAKSEFVSTVSHELRTPLTSINGSLSLVLNTMAEGEIPDRALRLLRIAQKNCDRLIPLVNDILDLEKFASGRVQFAFTRENVSPLVRRALVDNKPFADQFDVRLRLVRNALDAEATIDVNRFQQVMANLLSNASKFSRRGGAVEVAIEREGTMLKISVSDTGKGIPPEFRDRIFQPFSQADASSTRENGGTGLGLNITKQIVERMGGRVGFTSEPGVLTTFWFTVPATGAEIAMPPARPAPATAAAATSRRPRILHIETDTDFAEIVAASFGPQAELVHSTRQGGLADLIGAGAFDLVIVDSALAEGADARLIDMVVRSQPQVPIVALTASDKAAVDPRVVRVIRKTRTRFDEIVALCLDTIAHRATADVAK